MEVGYMNVPMSYNSVGKIMVLVKRHAGLLGEVKGHSIRKTCITKLMHKGVAPVIIAQLSGHKDLNSLNSYGTASEAQQRDMSDMLQGVEGPPRSLGASTHHASTSHAPSSAAGSAAQLAQVVPGPETFQQQLAGMFSGATIQGNVNIQLHYGNVASSTSTARTSVTVSPKAPALALEASPKVAALPLEPDFGPEDDY